MLVVAAWLRVLAVVAPEPVLAYADNFDQIRTQRHFGLYVVADGEPVTEATPAAPHQHFQRTGDRDRANAYWSTELVTTGMADAVDRVLTGNRSFDVRVKGVLVALAFLVGSTYLVVRLARVSAGAGLVSAAVLGIVLADPAHTLWLNTFYGEFTAVWLLGWTVGLVALELLPASALRGWERVILALSLVGLGATKVQYLLLPALVVGVLVVATAPWRGGGRRLVVAALMAVAALAPVAFQVVNLGRAGYMETVRAANATDTYFGAVLPASGHPARAARRLGLPPRCVRFIGHTWYDPGMQPPPCAEVVGVSRVRLVALLVREPAIPVRMATTAVPRSRPWRLRLGEVAGETYARAPWWRAPSWRGAVDALPGPVYAAFLSLPVAAGLGAAAVAVRHRRLTAPAILLVLGSLVGAYVFWTAVFGDGYIEMAKHVHLLQAVVPGVAVGLVAAALSAGSRAR